MYRFVVGKYHLFPMSKEKSHKFLNDFSLTQLKDYMKHEHDRGEHFFKRV